MKPTTALLWGASIALLLALAAGAKGQETDMQRAELQWMQQEIPASYNDPYANDLVVAGFFANGNRIATCAENENKTLSNCHIEQGHTLDEFANVMAARLNGLDEVIKSLLTPAVKHSSHAPHPHKSHRRTINPTNHQPKGKR